MRSNGTYSSFTYRELHDCLIRCQQSMLPKAKGVVTLPLLVTRTLKHIQPDKWFLTVRHDTACAYDGKGSEGGSCTDSTVGASGVAITIHAPCGL